MMDVRALLVAMLVAASATAVAQGIDLRGGWPQPSIIPNHQTTRVVLPGLHLAHVRLTATGDCSVVSYTPSENEIVMLLTGNRSLGESNRFCNLHVRRGTAKVYLEILVGWTAEEKGQMDDADRAETQQVMQAAVSRAGRRWVLRFASGETQTYIAKQAAPAQGAMLFTSSGGGEVTIGVGNDNSVVIVNDGGCLRTGQLIQGRVTNGASRCNCSPAGGWTVEMK